MVLPRVCSRLYVPLLLAVCATLALGAASGDSPTIDEPGHLVAGLAVWHEGDFRMAPDHPPLARLWAALPVFLGSHAWQTLGSPGWSDGDWWRFGRWLFERNDPEALLWPARAMMVGLLVATCLATWWVARSLFGPAAGALALLLAAFDPGFLAHGHYVTTDMPMTLATLACLGTFARLLAEIRLGRLVAAAAALVALSLAKLAWVLVLPALGAMALGAWLRSEAPLLARPGRAPVPLHGRARRAEWLAALAGLLALALWAGLWAAYGCRYAALTGPDADHATMYPGSVFGGPRPEDMEEAWELLLRDPQTARPREGLLPALVRVARRHRLLPEAYVYGLAYLDRKSQQRTAYLSGEIYAGGRVEYFPLTLAWKTPLPSLVLAGMGLAAVALGRARSQAPLLALGLGTFTVVYAVVTLGADLNIGQRHLLPLYPAVFVAAGAAAAWADTRVGARRRAGAGGLAVVRLQPGGLPALPGLLQRAGGRLAARAPAPGGQQRRLEPGPRPATAVDAGAPRREGDPAPVRPGALARRPRSAPAAGLRPAPAPGPAGTGLVRGQHQRAPRAVQALPARGHLAGPAPESQLSGALGGRALRDARGRPELRRAAARPAGQPAASASRGRTHRHVPVRLPARPGRPGRPDEALK